MNLQRKISLVFIFTFTIVAVIDSTIVKFFAYSDIEFSTLSNVTIFVLFFIVFSIIGVTLLRYVKKNNTKSAYRLTTNLNIFHTLSFITQILMIAIILLIIFQMMFLHKYNIGLLHASTIITHGSALTFLVFLVILFLGWFKSKRNYIIILYLISFSIISINVILSLVYLEYQFFHSTNSWDRKPYPIHSYITRQESIPWSSSLKFAFEVLYLFSFLTIWMATASLLKQYQHRLGRTKYFTLISIPLIYYLFTFEGYFGNVFSPLLLAFPITFGVFYVLFFSATKQVGALLFSLAFWTASSLVVNDKVRRSLLISAIGIAILFGSIEITTLQYRLYPPFGLVTEAFMPLGAYLLLVGIFTSATNVARDAKLRKEFYKSAISQFNLLKTIGVTQMEKELLKEYKPVLARSNELEETQYQPLEQSDVKEIIHDVLQELQSRKNHATKDDRNED